MESLRINANQTTPKIDFDIESFVFGIEGECRPENVLVFFEPVSSWLKNFTTHIEKTTELHNKWLEVDFKLEYFNSSSAKFVFNIFKAIKSWEKFGVKAQVNWHYDILDEDHLECGQEYEKILKLKFNYIALQD